MHKLSYDTPRYKLTPERVTPLIRWFDNHKDHPYPSRLDKIALCHESQLTFTQVRKTAHSMCIPTEPGQPHLTSSTHMHCPLLRNIMYILVLYTCLSNHIYCLHTSPEGMQTEKQPIGHSIATVTPTYLMTCVVPLQLDCTFDIARHLWSLVVTCGHN